MIHQDNVYDATPTGVGIASSDYANRTQKLISLITLLRALGAQADFDLPRIAVIGNQSAGKSSLVEAISGINLPRASGTCTRCPMECRLIRTKPTEPWSCQILLRKETDENGFPLATNKKEEPFGPPVTDKSELEEAIRRAQLAILNPGVAAAKFIDFDTTTLSPRELPLGSTKQLQFSSNVVCLDISGPDLTDLSFIDLPGIISNVAAGEDRNNIEAVRRMVRDHIQGKTLILLTITMRDDIDNQGAADLARSADENGSRTIGVLTKADLVQYGEHDAWLRVLEGTSNHKLQLGYFVTKQPSPKELEEKISFDEARQREREFFELEHPWNDKDHLKSRMGTTNLTNALSNLLGKVINDALPDLRAQSKKSALEVQESLARLPPPPSENPAAELLRLVTGFSNDVANLVTGTQRFEGLIQRCLPAYITFKRGIRSTAPDFRPFSDPNDSGIDREWNPDVPIQVDDEGDSKEGGILPRKRPSMYLSEVREHIRRSLTRELPFNVPFQAKVTLIEMFFADWQLYCDSCFDSVYKAASEELGTLVTKHFGQISATGLCDHILTIVEDQIECARKRALERIQWMLELESPPFTLNDHYFSSYREKYLAKFKAARSNTLGAPWGAGVDAALSALAAIGLSGLKEEDLHKLRGTDSWEEELIVMAETAAYFHVSYKRIIDNIPRIIDHDFLRTISKEMQGALIKGLLLGTEKATERASMYLSEGEGVRNQRKELMLKKDRLDGVLRALFQFGM